MKILYFKWNSFGTEDIEEALKELGHELAVAPYSQDDVDINDELIKSIKETIEKEKPDAAFSSNYYPPIAKACHETGTNYISWVYDSPHVLLYSYTTIYETNNIYVFDREQYKEFAGKGIGTIHYMPLAANPIRLRKVVEDKGQQALFENSRFFNKADIVRRVIPFDNIDQIGIKYFRRSVFLDFIKPSVIENFIIRHPISPAFLQGFMPISHKSQRPTDIIDIL